jgi:hypothetical protein
MNVGLSIFVSEDRSAVECHCCRAEADTPDELVECGECGKSTCPLCLDFEASICDRCGPEFEEDDDAGECDGCGREVDVLEACEDCWGDFCCLCLDGRLCSDCWGDEGGE